MQKEINTSSSVPREAGASMPRPKYPVGTKLLLSQIDPETFQFYWGKLVRETVKATRVSVDYLQKEGLLPGMIGKKMMACHKASIIKNLDMMRYADSIEIAGHQPVGLHGLGSPANQCYLNRSDFSSGVGFRCYLLFRRIVDEKSLYYIHPHSIVNEYDIKFN